jgi:hypothetical protein
MPPFGRPERDVVLHPVAGEDLDLPVVHLDGARHDDLALRMGEDPPDARIERQQACRLVERFEHGGENRSVFGHAVIVTWNYNSRDGGGVHA